MSGYGVVDQGFVIKPYDAIRSSLEQYAKQYLGDDIALGVDSRFSRFLDAISYDLDDIWQLTEDVYNSAYLDFAIGNSLDFYVAGLGVVRIAAVKASGKVTFHRDASGNEIAIPKGTRVATTDETIRFETTEVITMVAADTDASGNIEAVLASASGNVTSNIITVIVDTISGIDSVNNTDPTTKGRDKETDAELRLRVKTTSAAVGAGTLDAILARVRSAEYVPDIVSAIIVENDTSGNVGGLPPHSFMITAFGGEDNEVAQAIWDTKPAGIESSGNTLGYALDINDASHNIYFERPIEVDVSANVVVTTDGSDVSGNDIRDAVVAYINALDIGGNVVYNSVVAAVMSIAGVVDATTVQIAKVGSAFGTSNITIAANEIARTTNNDVEVTIS